MENNQESKLNEINKSFYELIVLLRETKFDFCAYVVEEAYRFYMTELEKRLNDKELN